MLAAYVFQQNFKMLFLHCISSFSLHLREFEEILVEKQA